MANTEKFIKDLYLNLLKQGWTLNDIDDMDILWYFELLAYKGNGGGQKQVYIDQIL